MFRILSRVNSSLRGWRAFLAAVLLLAALALLDQQILRAAPLYGIRPADAEWVLSTGDFPSYWRNLESGDVYARIREDWPRPQGDLELAVRLATGIRPTPARWRMWLGERLTVAASREGMGCCVYPGLLLRVAGRLAQVFGYSPDATGIAQFNGTYYTWRDGFLILSRDRPYVEACLKRGDSGPLRSGADTELAFHWTGPHEGYVRTRPGDGFPVEGRLHITVSDGDSPLSLTNAWPTPPVAAITARNTDDLASIGTAAEHALGAFDQWDVVKSSVLEAVDHWELQPLHGDWDAGVEQVSLALQGVDTTEFFPVPDLSFVMRQQSPIAGDHPLRPLFADNVAIDYEWHGQPGVYVPWLGEGFSPCLSGHGLDWIATLNEPAMASLVGALGSGPSEPPDVDAALRISWGPASEILKSLVLHAAERELIPGYSEQEARSDFSPKFDALGKLGALQLNARALEDGWLEFDGRLFSRGESHGE